MDLVERGTGGPNVQGTHSTVARAIARDGIVLLKNTNNALPLKKPASLAVIGLDSVANPNGINSCTDRDCDDETLAMARNFLGNITYEMLIIGDRDGDLAPLNFL
jgi:beta-glucosidase-like glycosyl hydrolase